MQHIRIRAPTRKDSATCRFLIWEPSLSCGRQVNEAVSAKRGWAADLCAPYSDEEIIADGHLLPPVRPLDPIHNPRSRARPPPS